MSVRFRQAFHDTFVRSFCPSKSAIFQCTKQRTMSQMYNSMYYRSSHPACNAAINNYNHAGGSSAATGGQGGGGLTASAVIAHPINIVTHSIIKNQSLLGGGGGPATNHPNGIHKNLVFDHRISTTLIEEDEFDRSEHSKNPAESDVESLEFCSDHSSSDPSFCPPPPLPVVSSTGSKVNIITNPQTKGALNQSTSNPNYEPQTKSSLKLPNANISKPGLLY